MMATNRNSAAAAAKVSKVAELELPAAHLLLLRLNHAGPDEHLFFRDDRYWIDLCMTPRRPEARARYVDRWGPHRFHAMGSMIALPPGFNLDMKHQGGRHISLICSLKAEAVHQWLDSDFEWTDRRLEALLDISSSEIRALLLKLAEEVRQVHLGRQAMCDAIVVQLSIELARYLSGVGEPAEHGGLADWRLRIIEKRLTLHGEPPSLPELAKLCDISVRQLSRGFRASRGCSVGEYMAQTRIDAAKRRLATEESIKSIATELGFSSQSTFTYVFRRATGVTPNEFRKRILRALEPRLRRI